MKRLRVSELIPGMVTAEDVFNYNGQMVLPCGMTLTDKAITRLEFYSILSVKVEDMVREDGFSYESATLSERIQASAEFKAFTKDYDDGLKNFKDSINRLVTENEPIPVDEMLDNALHILAQASTKYNTLDMLHNMRQYDDLTFAHSMNVALICNVFSKWLKWSPEDQRLLTMCGLLHDIGKVKIPDAIIKKPDRLTEEEYKIVKTHAVEGYHILKAQNLDSHVVNSALMHHEKCDGTGYPLGLASERIDRFAKAVAVVDVYDAMTSARIYRGALCPFRVIELFESEGLQKYDAEFILTFLENIVNTYLHNEVRLSDGRVGHIIFSNKMNLSKPIVQCGDEMVNLSLEHDLHIDELL
ncbi:MAG: HD-GYP domain-containing protein [Lachnospiraceae bacterium]|nr:HD-GYP domain-containing protein [Lachnospiraceae bacterium]